MLHDVHPVRLRHHGGDDIREIHKTDPEEDPLERAIGSLDDQEPDEERAQGDRDIFRDPEELHTGRPARELRRRIAEICQKQCNHEPERD